MLPSPFLKLLLGFLRVLLKLLTELLFTLFSRLFKLLFALPYDLQELWIIPKDVVLFANHAGSVVVYGEMVAGRREQ
jgi:hypothetical protein